MDFIHYDGTSGRDAPAPFQRPGQVESFNADPDVFHRGQKSLNGKSVKAAHGDHAKVVSIAARHNTRELKAEFCASGGRIAPFKSRNNYALIGPMNAAAIVAKAKQVMLERRVKK